MIELTVDCAWCYKRKVVVEWDDEALGEPPAEDDYEDLPSALCSHCDSYISKTARAWGYDAAAHEKAHNYGIPRKDHV